MLASLKLVICRHPKLNALVWDTQYRLGLWRYLDGCLSTGAFILELVERYSPNARILDVGCGTTANLPLGGSSYRTYHGLDISVAAIDKARTLKRPRCTFEVGDLQTFTSTEVFDAILLREVLYYLPEQQIPGTLARLSDLLSPSGRIFVQVSDEPDRFSTLAHRIALRVLEEHERSETVDELRSTFVVLGQPVLRERPSATA